MTALGAREAITRAKIVAAMGAAGDVSVSRLCHVTGLTETTIHRHVHALHRDRQAHIVRWVVHSGKYRPPAAIYRLGQGIDAVQPRASAALPPPESAALPPRLPAPIPLGIWGLSW